MMNETNSSILVSIKKALGIQDDYTHFDPELIMHINSTISILAQLGVCDDSFTICDSNQTWYDLLNGSKFSNRIELIKSYVYMRVKLLFDPPSSSFVLDSMTRQISEFEWRINCIVDPNSES